MKVIIVDFQDSFTHTIAHYLEGLGARVEVQCHLTVNWNDLDTCDRIVLSPGPGLPDQKKNLSEIIDKYHLAKPILGVCLGMQAIGTFFGAKLYNLKKVNHGVKVKMHVIDEHPIFKDLPEDMYVGLYHSWAVELSHCNGIVLTAQTNDQIAMAIKHEVLPIYGVQFHPESIMTEYGREILKNFLELT